jgi:hypothetical protein
MITAGFISHDGFLIAATEDTLAQALSQLQDQTNVDVKERWTSALEFLQWRYPDGDRIAIDPHVLPASPTGSGISGEPSIQTQDQDASPTKEVEQEGDTSVRVEQPGGLPKGPSVDAQCLMCDAKVPQVLAEMSLAKWNDVRCRGCGNW